MTTPQRQTPERSRRAQPEPGDSPSESVDGATPDDSANSADNPPDTSRDAHWRELEQRLNDLPDADGAYVSSLIEAERAAWQLASVETAKGDENVASLPDLLQGALRDWQQAAAGLQLAAAAEECRLLLEQREADRLTAWESHVERALSQANVDACFAALSQSATLAWEQLSGGGDVDASDGSPLGRLATLRDRLRAALKDCLQASSPDLPARQRWTTELVDRSETVLSAIDDLPPVAGETALTLTIDDLSWHLAHVERRRGSLRSRLSRKRRRLHNELQDRQLQRRLAARFGAGLVRNFERLVLALIVMVLALLGVEAAFELSPAQTLWLNVVDTIACGAFLTEFFVKLRFAPSRWRWFRRHALIDLAPSIPFGLLLHGLAAHGSADLVQWLRALRILRAPALVRGLRGVAFLLRGLDRLAQRFGPLLNRNVILYPTLAERRRERRQEVEREDRRLAVFGSLRKTWRRRLHATPPEERAAIANLRLTALREASTSAAATSVADDWEAERTTRRARETREITAAAALRRLAALSPQVAEASLAPDALAKLARAIRTFSSPPWCWLPLIRSFVTPLSGGMSDSQVVVAAARRSAATLKSYHDRWFWAADLHGTVTPSEFVDRLGTMLVKSSFRPAYRLVMFGGVFLLVKLLLNLTTVDFLHQAELFLQRVVGPALLLLGGVCFVVLGFGWWLKRLAREATEFYEQAAEAQFLSLTEVIRSRHLRRDAEIMYRRVLEPEWSPEAGEPPDVESRVARFAGRVRLSLLGDHEASLESHSFDALERVVMLYRDSLDGALFVDSDNRTTCQLLGNPAVRQFLALSQRVARKDVRALRLLDLARQKSLFGGPYLWFNFISRATAHATACLIVDYNRHAVPLSELELTSTESRARHTAWLRSQDSPGAGDVAAATDESRYATTAFTALHFLDFDPQRDRQVQDRFGNDVLERLKRDRGRMIRRVFGAFPWQLLPKEDRVLNLYAWYESYLAGGRALFLPLTLAWAGLRRLVRLVKILAQAVQEIRRPNLRVDRTVEVEPDFSVAVRKIQRMRGPVVDASIALRSMFDPQYLGVPLPGDTRTGLEGADIDADLKFLRAEPWIQERRGADRRRAEADMRRLARLHDEGLLARLAARLSLPADSLSTPDHRRAAAAAYLADFRGVRRHLSSAEIVVEVFQGVALEQVPPPPLFSPWGLRRAFHTAWNSQRARGERDGVNATCAPPTEEAMQLAWRAACANLWGVGDALRVQHRLGPAAKAEGERLMAEILKHPGRIIEQLVTLRTVQTLAILDVLNYREHVFQLGDYADQPDVPRDMLRWETCGDEQPQRRTSDRILASQPSGKGELTADERR